MKHFILYCTECEKIIDQCRCVGTKEIRYGICDECKAHNPDLVSE